MRIFAEDPIEQRCTQLELFSRESAQFIVWGLWFGHIGIGAWQPPWPLAIFQIQFSDKQLHQGITFSRVGHAATDLQVLLEPRGSFSLG